MRTETAATILEYFGGSTWANPATWLGQGRYLDPVTEETR
jgi:hypothetical protein